LSSAKKFSSSSRLWTCRSPDSESPFCTASMTMDRNDGGVDHRIFHVGVFRYCLEYALENTNRRPVAKPSECAAPVAEFGREITPRAAGAGLPLNCFHEKPVIPAAPPGITLLAQTVRLHLAPLNIPQNHVNHSNSPFWELESNHTQVGNPGSPLTLNH